MAGSFAIRQSKTILARSCEAGSWLHRLVRPSNYGRGRGVGRPLGVGAILGVGVGLGVDDGVGVAVGVAVAVGVGVGVGVAPDCAQYLPPVLNAPVALPPPHMIISLPVQTAV
jgi:hypothetical protein